MLLTYLSQLSAGMLVLWVYLIWYMVVAVRYFDPNPRLWLTSVGLSLFVGTALCINARTSAHGAVKLSQWQAFRFFLIPFCVSSFSALVKDRGFTLIFSDKIEDLIAGGASCVVFALVVWLVKTMQKKSDGN
jgi:hypothetical protein